MDNRLCRTAFGVLLAAGCSTSATSLFAADKLRLVLEGPFVLCETEDGKSLRILLPNVIGPSAVGQHATPGIKSLVTEKELAAPGTSKDYKLSVTPDTARPMAIETLEGLDADGNKQYVTLDHIAGKCSASPSTYYAAVTVPKPDTIRPLTPVVAILYDCEFNLCETAEPYGIYGTSSELVYNSVDLPSLRLIDLATSKEWNPQVEPEDGYLGVFVRPLHPDDDDEMASLVTHDAMMEMVGIVRCFLDPHPFPITVPSGHDGRHMHSRLPFRYHGKLLPASRVKHNDCHAPQLLVCKQSSCQ